MVIFHSYVSLPEGRIHRHGPVDHDFLMGDIWLPGGFMAENSGFVGRVTRVRRAVLVVT